MAAPNYAIITIDYKKCTTPFDCKLCLQGCPQSVFHVAAIKVERGRETNPKEPGNYILHTPFRDKCTGCNICLELCPVNALTITFPGSQPA